ncbi:5-formyltetrahydrofolate cyclo-ligase [Leptotrichia sp. OH3620_COT-345]|uniref:5-formyltetrahydrofolate cyclo-ligase n=1 Tax=Leptotrichia sp. OH3620_COT-345 TaxID=2491048 RepID=UPI000F647E39|nr:5-formyltetrahydrofolate cyclo-ligase [Leptotrichia sp. OH3620_COT-345]RRD39215.1 5-formyltetrahydrofolate cyclo-ligase [Leptotrichia sp. OH3620_COT-345]
MSKDKIRSDIIQKRNLLTEEFIEKNSNIIIGNLKTYIEKAQNIMIFMDMKNEVKITKLINLYLHKNFYIPKIFPDGDMKINMYNEKDLVLHKFGYYESNSPVFYNENILELVIVPAVAFDKSKNRIGFGKGYYDRFLHKIGGNPNKTLNIGICYDFQLLDEIPFENHDIKVDFVITEKRTIY